MKAKIGNIEIEGTPEEIKEFIGTVTHEFVPINSPNKSGQDSKNSLYKTDQTGSDTIQSKHKAEIDKDYDTCYKHGTYNIGKPCDECVKEDLGVKNE